MKLYAAVDEVQTRSAAASYSAKLYVGDVQIGGQSADIWAGTSAQYAQLPAYDANKLYLTVDVGQTTSAKLYAGNVMICDSALFGRVTALETAVTTLQNTVVTSAAIRTIEAVQDMPVSPSATVLYVVDGGTS